MAFLTDGSEVMSVRFQHCKDSDFPFVINKGIINTREQSHSCPDFALLVLEFIDRSVINYITWLAFCSI